MENIQDKKYGVLVVLEESSASLFVRRLADEDHRAFWIPKAKLNPVEAKEK